jgi:hypothetical protein
MKTFNCTKTISYYFPCPQILWDECSEDDQIDLCPMSGAVAPPCPIWSCTSQIKPNPIPPKPIQPNPIQSNPDTLVLVVCVVGVLIFLLLASLLLLKFKKMRRLANQNTPAVTYRPLQGYRERLLATLPEYNLPNNYEAEINERKRPE